ncbi:MAG: zinc-binding dehydrogenase [Chloroflexi bacterium]|nr:zinc-binding dehydrogenase [Chloroflexota bacterium]
MIPEKMRVVRLKSYQGIDALEVVEVPTPKPGPGEVLIKVLAAPVNPSDLMFIREQYGFVKPLPAGVGFEGCGEVVASGPGLPGQLYVGRRVVFGSQGDWGSWGEYVVTSAQIVIPIARRFEVEQAAMFVVNPMTAWGMVEIAGKEGHRALIQNAAASALGKMILALCNDLNLPLINIVRRQEQIDLLQSLGAEHVLNSTHPDFDNQLKAKAHDLRATLALDAVSGTLTARTLSAMPNGSHLILYGSLSNEAVTADPRDILFWGKRISGFILNDWMAEKGVLPLLMALPRISSSLWEKMDVKIQGRFSLDGLKDGLRQYERNMTAGKILLLPHASQAD